jgi:oxygen-independent coproporphyrinogen-3 oxidase
LQLFMGGGTPTALPPDLLQRLLTSIFERAPSHASQVHTVEASPESVTAEHIRALRECGVDRVSMGIQSLDDAVLGGVHRRHSSEQALAACRLLLDEGMILNIDLIYGLPGQTEASFQRDLEGVATQGVHSVTLYDLRVNEQTPVAKVVGADESLGLARLVRWRALVKHAAEELGFKQTRWHTFKRPDAVAARHRRAPCYDDTARGYQLGLGMSARSHLGFTIYRNHEDFETYLGRVEAGQSPVEEVFALQDDDRRTQFMARTLGDGMPLEREAYRAAVGRTIDEDFGAHLARLEQGGLLEDTGERIALSESGKLVYDLVTLSFYPNHARRWLEGREDLLRRRIHR